MNDSVLKTLTVSFLVCLFCSLVVSYAAVSLRDMQNLNKLNDQRIKILKTAAIYNPDESIEAHERLIDATNAAVHSIRPGVTRSKDLFSTMSEVLYPNKVSLQWN